MSSCVTITQNFKKEVVESFLDFFKTTNEDSWFIAIGNPIPWSFDREIANTKTVYNKSIVGNDSIVPDNLDTEKEKYDFYKVCTAMKRILTDDISFLIPRNKWEQNTFYYPYRDNREIFTDDDLTNRPFYVYNENNRCVYKCIENSFFGPSAGASAYGRSLYPPTGTNTDIIDTNDGYKWKFMYQLSSTDEFKFSVSGRNEQETYIPVKYISYDPTDSEEITQKATQDAAVDGSISSIYVKEDYRNAFKLDTDKCLISSVEPIYPRIDYAAGITSIDIDYYGLNTSVNSIKDLFVHVIDGSGSGQVRLIKSSSREKIDNSYYLRVSIDALDEGISGFSGDSGSMINIIPSIDIFGDGEANDPSSALNSSLETALAIPFFDSDNFLQGTDLLDIGKNYTFGKASISKGLTAVSITENPTIPSDLLQVSMSPFGGHGSNAVLELGASRLIIKTSFEGSENGELNSSNDFRQIAIIKNPDFTDTTAIIRTEQENLGSTINVGDTVELSGSGITATGVVANIYEFNGGNEGREFVVKGISGDIGNYTTIEGVSIDSYDGIEFTEYAGLENKNITRLIANSTVTGITSRDIVVGAGNKSSGIVPSLASGKVLGIENNTDVLVENVRGKFKSSELVYAITPGGTGSGSFTISDVRESTPSTFKNAYNMTTRLNLVSAENYYFEADSFVSDNLVYSFETNTISVPKSSSEFKSNAFVFDWTPQLVGLGPAGTTNTGVLEVVGAKKGTFSVGDYILYYKDNIARYATINSIVLPEIRYGSGEVLYVQNFTGIERFGGNNEQINLVLGL